MVIFWASWCAPCRGEAPGLAALSRGCRPRSVRFVGVDERDDRTAAQAFDRSFGISYPSLSDPAGDIVLAFRGSVQSRLARSWLTAVGAGAAALTGDRGGALSLLGQARDHLDAADGKEAWMYEWDHAALAAYRGQCHLRLGQAGQAAAAFEAGMASLPRSCERRGAFLAIGLAEASLAGGAVDAAVALAGRALAVFAACGSVAGLRRVQGLRCLLADAGCRREAAELDQQIRDHLAATS